MDIVIPFFIGSFFSRHGNNWSHNFHFDYDFGIDNLFGLIGFTSLVGIIGIIKVALIILAAIKANKGEVAYAIANITLFGILAMLVYPYFSNFYLYFQFP